MFVVQTNAIVSVRSVRPDVVLCVTLTIGRETEMVWVLLLIVYGKRNI